MSLEETIASFAWVEREDGTVVLVGEVELPVVQVPIWTPFGYALVEVGDPVPLARELDLTGDDTLRGVVNE